MIIKIVPLLVLALAAYRITRFLVIDTMLEGSRTRFYSFLTNRSDKNGPLHLIWYKLFELFSCTWCLGFWVSVILYTIYAWNQPDFTKFDIINVFAIAGIQGMVHALEPDDA
jgi:hypothetical protein